jgi:4-amino-4-deoxy-L-arabinose transferase-like glycosyltransferase
MVSVSTHLNKAKISSHFSLIAMWFLLTIANLLNHHLIPLDETRYATVAWEMWINHDFLVPHLNGQPYHHKPPLLFWLYNLGWLVFGVSEWWLLLVSPLFALLNLFLLRYLAKILWPEKPIADLAPWLLSGSLVWGAFQNAATFDMVLAACILVAMVGLVKASRDFLWQSWALFSLGIGFGLLAKGPVVFVPILAPFFAAAYWSETARNNHKSWFIKGILAIIAGILLALIWAVPASISGGEAYANALLWHQTVDRVTNSFAHNRSFFWYFFLTPVFFFPWFFWPRVWQNLHRRELLNDFSFRFCTVWFVAGFMGFSLISGKQIHYLIPLLPAVALMLARALPDMPLTLKLGDYLPFFMILIFGLSLMIAPVLPDQHFYHWLENRKLWWAVLIILIGLGGILSQILQKSTSPKLLSLAVLSVLMVSMAGFFSSTGNAFNLQQASTQLQAYLISGQPLAWAGKYDGQFEFLLRLTKPMNVIEKKDMHAWLESHSRGHIISIEKANTIPSNTLKIEYVQYYREDKLWVQTLK